MLSRVMLGKHFCSSAFSVSNLPTLSVDTHAVLLLLLFCIFYCSLDWFLSDLKKVIKTFFFLARLEILKLSLPVFLSLFKSLHV